MHIHSESKYYYSERINQMQRNKMPKKHAFVYNNEFKIERS